MCVCGSINIISTNRTLGISLLKFFFNVWKRKQLKRHFKTFWSPHRACLNHEWRKSMSTQMCIEFGLIYGRRNLRFLKEEMELGAWRQEINHLFFYNFSTTTLNFVWRGDDDNAYQHTWHSLYGPSHQGCPTWFQLFFFQDTDKTPFSDRPSVCFHSLWSLGHGIQNCGLHPQ